MPGVWLWMKIQESLPAKEKDCMIVKLSSFFNKVVSSVSE